MKAFVNYTKNTINRFSTNVENFGLFKNHYYKKNYQTLYRKIEDYNIKDVTIFSQLMDSEVKAGRFNEALKFYYLSYDYKFGRQSNFMLFRKKSSDELKYYHERIVENYKITSKQIKTSILNNTNSIILKGIDIKKDRREYVFNQRWNILFFVLVLYLYTNLPKAVYQSAGNSFFIVLNFRSNLEISF